MSSTPSTATAQPTYNHPASSSVSSNPVSSNPASSNPVSSNPASSNPASVPPQSSSTPSSTTTTATAFSAPLPPNPHTPHTPHTPHSNTTVLSMNNVPSSSQPPHSSSHPSSPPIHRTPFKPSAPVQIPRPRSHPKHHNLHHHHQHHPLHQTEQQQPVRIDLSPHVPIPRSLPNLPPCYPASLFGTLSPDDEHVTVWEPLTGKTVAGNAAPYRRNLSTWLHAHPGWEEKADELKSSKRRSAARRARAAAHSFSVLCCYPVAALLAQDSARRLTAMYNHRHCDQNAIMSWTTDDFVRLQEALFTLAQHCHSAPCARAALSADRWHNVLVSVGGAKSQATVLYCSHHMLKRGIAKNQQHHGLGAAVVPSSQRTHHHEQEGHSSAMGSPASVSSYDMATATATATATTAAAGGSAPRSLPLLQSDLDASLLERSFRAPREPRVTVWNPANGRTISGNAAPCRRNLQAWLQLHPGWVRKEEGQLSSSRRNRTRKGTVGAPVQASTLSRASTRTRSSGGAAIARARATATATATAVVEADSHHFHEALQGLLGLSRSPAGQLSGAHGGDVGNEARMVMDEEMQVSADDEEDVGDAGRARKRMALTSSISSSLSGDDKAGTISDEEDGDAVMMEMFK